MYGKADIFFQSQRHSNLKKTKNKRQNNHYNVIRVIFFYKYQNFLIYDIHLIVALIILFFYTDTILNNHFFQIFQKTQKKQKHLLIIWYFANIY